MRSSFWLLSAVLLFLPVGLFAQPKGIGTNKNPSGRSPQFREITNTMGMKLVVIQAGEFLMGSTPAEIEYAKTEAGNNWYDNEGPKHKVRISKGFFLAATPVTQAQFRRLMGTNPSWFSADGGGRDALANLKTDDFPVDSVSWNDANEFCCKLSQREARTYRLPTEAEWEYACRAGTTTAFHTGATQADLERAGWSESNSQGKTHAVGKMAPNAWGLYDMHGNVGQWCEDWLENGFYEHSPTDDPAGPAIGEYRILRGGSWRMSAWSCRSASRLYARPDNQGNDCGFRVVLETNTQ